MRGFFAATALVGVSACDPAMIPVRKRGRAVDSPQRRQWLPVHVRFAIPWCCDGAR